MNVALKSRIESLADRVRFIEATYPHKHSIDDYVRLTFDFSDKGLAESRGFLLAVYDSLMIYVRGVLEAAGHGLPE